MKADREGQPVAHETPRQKEPGQSPVAVLERADRQRFIEKIDGERDRMPAARRAVYSTTSS
jgi:hypothetical protein